MLSAVKVAKRYVETALEYSKSINIKNGPQGPFDHEFNLKRSVRVNLFGPSDLFLYPVTDSGMNKKWGRSVTNAFKLPMKAAPPLCNSGKKMRKHGSFWNRQKRVSKIVYLITSHIPLLINDRVDIKIASDAYGVHVGQSEMPINIVRTLLGPKKIIGVSFKTPEQALKAGADGADYVGSGGVFPTNTKSNNWTIGLDGLRAVCLSSKIPVVAIGGCFGFV